MPYLVANDIRMFYRSIGTGPAVLLIAGNGMDSTAFDEQVSRFSKSFRCVVYDLRGIGGTDVTKDGYSCREMAADAFALLDELGIESAHVGGYSLGGAIAQEMAIASPARVTSLSLYSTFDRPDAYLRLRYELLVKIIRESTPEIWALFTAFSAFGEEYVNAHEGEVRREIERRVARWSSPTPPSKEGLEGHYRAILTHDATDRLHMIKVPTWIAVGSEDPVTPPHYSERLHAAISGSKLSVFKGRPHRILNFQADEFTQSALSFLLQQHEKPFLGPL
jgi:pimeloyl-ACP methyl ester carboxylesterase